MKLKIGNKLWYALAGVAAEGLDSEEDDKESGKEGGKECGKRMAF